MKHKTLIAIIGIVSALAIFLYTERGHEARGIPERALTDYKNATYVVEGTPVTLVGGVAQMPAAPGSASLTTTRFFGNVATGDLNSDGSPDVAFLLTQDGGGSGTFYYVVAALAHGTSYTGTNAIFLGDRIAPQTTEFHDGTIVVNYADRGTNDPMTAQPSMGVSRSFRVVGNELIETTTTSSPRS